MSPAERVKYAIKAAIAHVLYALGLLQLLQSITMRRKAVVLMYHRVLSADERSQTASHPAMVVDRDTFAAHMEVLKRRFVVLSLDQFADCIARGVPFPDSSCLITFDDGWRDNLTNALPVLRRHGLPALIFLPVNYIGQRRLFWREMLTHLLVGAVMDVREEPSRRPRLAALLAPARLAHLLDLTETDPRPAVIQALGVQPIAGEEVERLTAALAVELDLSVEKLKSPDAFVDWNEVDEMARQEIAFGGHGAEHRLLTRIEPELADAEIRVSKEVMASRQPPETLAFSYPNGLWSPEIADKVRSAGYRLAFTTREGFVSSADDPFTLKRLNVHEDVTKTPAMFLARLVGLFGGH